MFSNYFHHPLFRTLRTVARSFGILFFIKKVLSKKQSEYEKRFFSAIESAVVPGDVVWDVGANVGFYSSRFLSWVGSRGTMVAFEPLPKAYDTLKQVLAAHEFASSGVLRPVALSRESGKALMAGNVEGDITTTAHISDHAVSSNIGVSILVSTVDEEVAIHKTPFPSVVKIDVEGYEEDVLLGGTATFSQPRCRHMFIEMHFTRMDERKLGNSAQRIVAMLKSWGYLVRWTDASHLHAYRK